MDQPRAVLHASAAAFPVLLPPERALPLPCGADTLGGMATPTAKRPLSMQMQQPAPPPKTAKVTSDRAREPQLPKGSAQALSPIVIALNDIVEQTNAELKGEMALDKQVAILWRVLTSDPYVHKIIGAPQRAAGEVPKDPLLAVMAQKLHFAKAKPPGRPSKEARAAPPDPAKIAAFLAVLELKIRDQVTSMSNADEAATLLRGIAFRLLGDLAKLGSLVNSADFATLGNTRYTFVPAEPVILSPAAARVFGSMRDLGAAATANGPPGAEVLPPHVPNLGQATCAPATSPALEGATDTDAAAFEALPPLVAIRVDATCAPATGGVPMEVDDAEPADADEPPADMPAVGGGKALMRSLLDISHHYHALAAAVTQFLSKRPEQIRDAASRQYVRDATSRKIAFSSSGPPSGTTSKTGRPSAPTRQSSRGASSTVVPMYLKDKARAHVKGDAQTMTLTFNVKPGFVAVNLLPAQSHTTIRGKHTSDALSNGVRVPRELHRRRLFFFATFAQLNLDVDAFAELWGEPIASTHTRWEDMILQAQQYAEEGT